MVHCVNVNTAISMGFSWCSGPTRPAPALQLVLVFAVGEGVRVGGEGGGLLHVILNPFLGIDSKPSMCNFIVPRLRCANFTPVLENCARCTSD